MSEFIFAGLLGAFLIAGCCLLIYEFLRQAWRLLPKITWFPHLRVLALVGAIFVAHTINVWLFGLAYYLLNHYELGTLSGPHIPSGYNLDFLSCIYYSGVIYSTIGLGDIAPQGALRMITAVEGLTGFILIGWTVSFTYLAMQKFWELPHGPNDK